MAAIHEAQPVRAVAVVGPTFWRNRSSAAVTAKEQGRQSYAQVPPAPPVVAEGLIR